MPGGVNFLGRIKVEANAFHRAGQGSKIYDCDDGIYRLRHEAGP